MTKPRPSAPRLDALFRTSILLLPVLLLVLALPVAAQDPSCIDRSGCGPIRNSTGSAVICFTPATVAPATLWDQLQPADTGRLPSERDTTNFNEFRELYYARNWFYGVDVENGWILMGLAHGIGIWDGRTNPASPTYVTAKLYSPGVPFPYIPGGESSKIVFGGIAAPPGVDTMAAVAGYNGAGLLVFNLQDKTMPKPVYQSQSKTGDSVYAATLGNTHYAFMASSSPPGVFVFNLDKAMTFNGCLEDATSPALAACPGVLVGSIVTSETPYFVHGVGNYLAVSHGSSGGFEIYDVSNPTNPQLKLSALLGFFTGRQVQGVAMWQQGNSYYLGARLGQSGATPKQTAIYDVSCITSSCGILGAPLSALPLDSQSGTEYLTFSRSSGGKPFLYVGGDVSCGGQDGQQREWLLDVSNPAAPKDVSPQRTIPGSATYNGATVNTNVSYWTWYYRGSPTGFNLVTPRAGKFNGDYFYRAGRSIFDIHKLTTASPPVSDFTWSPSEIYPGTPVQFTDTSSGTPTNWAWTFQDGSPFTAIVQNPAVSFGSAGSKVVTLTAGNLLGPGSLAQHNVTVLDPNPAGTVSASAASVTQCQAVTFTANVTGAPPLTYSWQVLDPSSATVNPPGVVPGGSTFSWTSLPAAAPGTYTGQVTVKNGVNATGVVLSKQIQLTALPALTNITGVAPTTDNFVANTVQFTAPAFNGATQVVWDYGDGKTDTFTDPVAGKTPTHTYAAIGTFNAKVTISNCVNPGGSASLPVSVHITQTAPLVASFQAICQFGICGFTAGQPVTFSDSSQGADFWDYDWTHLGASAATCNFTDSGHTSAVLSHTYTSTGTFQPCLRVRRGASEQNVAVLGPLVVSTGGLPPSIVIVGPGTGQPNQAVTFSAFASNCTASSSGWTWSVSGGTIAGAATGTPISVTWATTGSKSITATNSGCTGAQGSTSINITSGDGGGGGGSLAAHFNFSPAAPKVGDAVAFDSSPSTGIPAGAGLSWTFGDGATAFGATATHVYSAAGNYSAQLTISPVGCLNTTCLSTEAKTITVAPGSGGGGGNTGGAQFTVSPESPAATTVATFDGSSSTNVPAGSQFGWDFGDSSPTGFGTVALHAYAQQGSYHVVLAISPPGCASVACLLLASKTVNVGPPPPVSADFSTDAQCTSQFGIDQCQAQATVKVNLTASAADATTYSWDFGDGSTGSGKQVSHAWAQPGTYAATLTTTKGASTASKARSFVVSPAPAPKTKTALLPLVAQSRGPLVQSNDLYLYNPGTVPLDVTLEFRKRGTPDVNPPQATMTLQPGSTLFAPDMLSSLFNVENVAGFITVVTGIDKAEPVITSFNSSGQTRAKLFGLTVPGTSLGSLGSATSTGPDTSSQFLVGLNDNPERQSSLGFSNPSDAPATYHLRFYDKTGRLITESDDLTLSGHDQRQFQVQEIRDLFGVNNVEDYRVEVRNVSGAQVFPFGSNVRLATGDPSFSEPGTYKTAKLYLLGAFTGAGAAKSTWQTDLLLSNVGDQPVQTTMTFTSVSNKAGVRPTQVTLQPGTTERLENVLFSQFGLRNGTGVMTLTSTSPNGIFPIAMGESYDNTHPTKRFGQSLIALSDADAADTTKKEVLVGLRQDGANKTTLWVLNPTGATGVYDIVYRGLNGAVLGTLPGVRIGAGQLRQISPTQHPLRKTGVPNGFTIEIVVKAGKALAAAQVVSTGTNDPAFIAGEVR
ncbi:MAG TPA: PKD domain-containing protein [Thermoanaerobaculia bacterium]|nr:PKD domain-containing protein [Thermoanaerobaculia bacterium]